MTHTRRSMLGLVGAGSLAAVAGCVGGGGGDPVTTTESTETTTTTTTTTDGSMDGPTVTVSSHSEYGDILTDAEGMTLYMFESDTKGSGKSTCYDSCAGAWPPLTGSEPTAGDGVTASLSTFERDDGSTQVAANGWPLYYFASDEEPGDAKGQGVDGFGGLWWVLAPDGTPIESNTTTTTTSDDGGGTTTTDGYDY